MEAVLLGRRSRRWRRWRWRRRRRRRWRRLKRKSIRRNKCGRGAYHLDIVNLGKAADKHVDINHRRAVWERRVVCSVGTKMDWKMVK